MSEASMEHRLSFPQQLKRERELRNWSQEVLAARVGTDPKTVSRWENGEVLPRPESREALCKLFGKNAEELGLLKAEEKRRARQYATGSKSVRHASQKEGLVEAPSVNAFYGRDQERVELKKWIVRDGCRVVAVLGIGGIGKSTLASKLVEQVEEDFDYIFWASLQNAPPPRQIMGKFLQFVSAQQPVHPPEGVDDQISLLISYLQDYRCLLILDNLESILQPHRHAGQYRGGYEYYGSLIQRLGEAQHQSCLLLTSREKPKEVAHGEGKSASVRSLHLAGMRREEARKLLHDKELTGTDEQWAQLVDVYGGNPLALKIVSEPIREVFGGDIGAFLHGGETAFGDIHDLLEQQFHRLSTQEQEILYWLAIEREALSLDELRTDMVRPTLRGGLPETLASLRRRSIIEKRSSARFTLQPVIMEYLIGKLVEQACRDCMEETFDAWMRYAFMKAQARDYVRESQIRLILGPIAEQLLAMAGRAELEQKLRRMLLKERQAVSQQESYAAGNALNLQIHLGWDLRGTDFSQMSVRQAYLQGVALPEVNFSQAHFVDAVFTSTFGNVQAVSFHPTGKHLALGTAGGDIWLYRVSDGAPALTCQGHTDGVWSIAFSPDGRYLASSSDDGTIRLWDITNRGVGQCLGVLQDHSGRVRAVAFSPDGSLLASGSDDRTIRLWDTHKGRCIRILQDHSDRVWSVSFHPEGNLLVSGSTDQMLRLWDVHMGNCLRVLQGHTASVRSVVFSPDGKLVVSGSDDHSVCLWNVHTGICLHTLHGHTNRVWSVAFSPRGHLLASSSEDRTIRIWNTTTWSCLRILQGHTHGVRSVMFSSSDGLLASGGDDQMCRTWEVGSGNCLRTLQGYTNRIWSVAFAPDGSTLASCSEDGTIRLWEISQLDTDSRFKMLAGRDHGARSIAFGPQGGVLASGGEDETVRLWDTTTGRILDILYGHSDWVRAVAFGPNAHILASGGEDHIIRVWERSLPGANRCMHLLSGHSSWVRSIAFHPAGNLLASGGDDCVVLLWDVMSGRSLHRLQEHTGHIRAVVFSPDGTTVVSGSEDHTIRLWDARDGKCLKTLTGHSGRVLSVVFSSDGGLLASGSVDQTIRLWDAVSGQCLSILRSHTNGIRSLAFSPGGRTLASGGDDGTIRLWDMHTHELRKTLVIEKPYERMNIAHVTGLTEAQRTALSALGAIEGHSSLPQ
jgi:WD40 repeat protein/transcriptional regulator with XRE-family HTH domain